MIARSRSLVWSTLVFLSITGLAHGQRVSPADRGDGSRRSPAASSSSKTHRTPMGRGTTPSSVATGWASHRWRAWRYWKTAWPVMRRRSTRLAQVVSALAPESDQTYDLALAILFLAHAQQGSRGEADAMIQSLGQRLARGNHDGSWDYQVPRGEPQSQIAPRRSRRAEGRKRARRPQQFWSQGDNSNTQFAPLGNLGGRSTWVRPRRGPRIDRRSLSFDTARRWSLGIPVRDARHAGHVVRRLDGTGDCRVTAEPGGASDSSSRGAALAADPKFIKALKAVSRDARRAGPDTEIYYLWSLERVCVALGLLSLDGFDWYAHGHGSWSIARKTTEAGVMTVGVEGSPEPAWRSSSCERPTSRSRLIECSGFRNHRARPSLSRPTRFALWTKVTRSRPTRCLRRRRFRACR